MPQFSLSEYFQALQALATKALDTPGADICHLPVRRFNPASLTTRSGRSVIGQLMKTAAAIVIEDLDLQPDHVKAHKQLFGLAGTAAVHCINDGLITEAQHYVVTTAAVADHLPGVRLWFRSSGPSGRVPS